MEPTRTVPPAIAVNDVRVPPGLLKTIGFCHRQRGAHVLRFNPVIVLACMDREQPAQPRAFGILQSEIDIPPRSAVHQNQACTVLFVFRT